MEMSKAAVTAKRDYYRKYRKNNAERIRAYKKIWNSENKEKISEHQKRYWEKKAAEMAEKAAN